MNSLRDRLSAPVGFALLLASLGAAPVELIGPASAWSSRNAAPTTRLHCEALAGPAGATQLVVRDRDGNVAGKYYKSHLTVGERTLSGITEGDELPVFTTDIGKRYLQVRRPDIYQALLHDLDGEPRAK